MRNCDGCSLCCFMTAVPEIAKPVFFWCTYCDGRGCKIYTTRPESCRTFVCLWYMNPQLGDEYRPDQCGVLFEKLVDSTTFLALVDPKRDDAWRSGPASKIITSLLRNGHAVVVNASTKQMILPEGKKAETVVAEINHALKRADLEVMKHGSSVVYQ